MEHETINRNPLEKWILKEIENRNIINKKNPTFEDIKEYQIILFKKLLDYAYNNSLFYKNMILNNKINIDEISSFDDLDDIPFTKPIDISKNPYHFLCVSRKSIAREFSSSGTSGINKKIAYAEDELIHISASIGAAMKLAGMNKKEDTLQIMYPTITGTWDPGLVMSKGCEIIGCNSIINGSRDFDDQLESLKKGNVNFFIGQASFIYNLSISKKKEIINNDYDIKTIISSSEPLLENQRETIESIWNCDVIRQWGTTELGLANAIECHHKNGYHTNSADLLYEIIDPKTGKRVSDGEKGELVVTTLNRYCMPLIRYRTGDITSMVSNKCKCGCCIDQRIIEDIERL